MNGRQWVPVVIVLAGLTLGGWALVRFRGETDRVAVNSRAPDFKAIDIATGDSVSFREKYKGSVTLINIWATWCGPCRTEMPAMQVAYAKLKPRGFRIAAVSIDEGSQDDVKKFVQEFGLTFDILQDRTTGIQQTYQTTGVPESFLLNQQGVIVKRVMGSHDWSSPVNVALINRLLDEAGAPRAPWQDTVNTAEQTRQ